MTPFIQSDLLLDTF